MSKRYQVIHELVRIRQSIFMMPSLADAVLQQAIMDALSPQHKELWDWIMNSELKSITTAEVMDNFGWKANHASTLLKELYTFGLLERTEAAGKPHGKTFIYQVADTLNK